MSIQLWSIQRGTDLSLRDEAEYQQKFGRAPVIVAGAFRNVAIRNSWLPASIWFCAHGQIQIQSRDQTIELQTGDVFVAEIGARVTVQSANSSDASLVGIVLPVPVLAKLVEADFGFGVPSPILFSQKLAIDLALHAPLVRLANEVERGVLPIIHDDTLIRQVLTLIMQAQETFKEKIERCPGRGFGYQRQLFQRLLRAHQYIELHGGNDASLARLGAIANLSPTHFQRLFKTTFGYSPHDLSTRVRMSLAKELLIVSARGVAEICRDLGFENRCAFARLFRQYFGLSPTEMRRRNLSSFIGPRHETRVEPSLAKHIAMA